MVTPAPTNAPGMTNTGVQRVTGDQIQMLAAYLQNLANSDQRAYSGLSGYLNGAPTLPREMMWQVQQQADRQFALDVASSGLQAAQFNYNQRMGEAQVRLQEQTLLASQRGPKNAIAYNYLLNDMAAPAGTERPSGGATGISQPYSDGTITMPSSASGDLARGQQQAAAWNAAHQSNPNGRVEQPSPGNVSMTAVGGTDGGNITYDGPPATPSLDIPTPEAAAVYHQQMSAAEQAYGNTGYTPLPAMAEGGISMSGPADAKASQITINLGWLPEEANRRRESNDAWQRDGGNGLTLSGIPGMAQGGLQMGSPVIVGDPKASAPQSPNIEMAAPIVEGGEPGMAVMPVDKMAAGAQGGSPAFDEGYQAMMDGVPDAQRMKADKEYLAGVMACQAEKAQAPQGEMPMAASGGVFSNTWYNPQEIANSPSIQKLAGSMPTTGFGGNKLDYTLPGTNTMLPAGNRANITTLSRMLPSELGFLEGVVETPREMGGLGLDFGDYLTSAQRAAPTGARFGASVYG